MEDDESLDKNVQEDHQSIVVEEVKQDLPHVMEQMSQVAKKRKVKVREKKSELFSLCEVDMVDTERTGGRGTPRPSSSRSTHSATSDGGSQSDVAFSPGALPGTPIPSEWPVESCCPIMRSSRIDTSDSVDDEQQISSMIVTSDPTEELKQQPASPVLCSVADPASSSLERVDKTPSLPHLAVDSTSDDVNLVTLVLVRLLSDISASQLVDSDIGDKARGLAERILLEFYGALGLHNLTYPRDVVIRRVYTKVYKGLLQEFGSADVLQAALTYQSPSFDSVVVRALSNELVRNFGEVRPSATKVESSSATGLRGEMGGNSLLPKPGVRISRKKSSWFLCGLGKKSKKGTKDNQCPPTPSQDQVPAANQANQDAVTSSQGKSGPSSSRTCQPSFLARLFTMGKAMAKPFISTKKTSQP